MDTMIGKEGLLIFISHRLSSCRSCDKILVFHDGELYETGTHEDLLQKGGIYAEKLLI